MSDELLTLSTRQPRPVISIDGRKYELRTPGEMKLTEVGDIEAQAQQAMKALQQESRSLKDVRTMEAVLTRVVARTVVRLPRRVLQRLGTRQKIEILNVFSKAGGQSSTQTSG